MPSRVHGYPDNTAGGRSPYSWPPQQRTPQSSPTSSPPSTQSAPYYHGYGVAPSGSYDSQRSPQQHPPEHRQSTGYEQYYANTNNPEQTSTTQQERVGPSSSLPSRNNSYDHGPSLHSRSTESTGSTEKTSPPKFPGAPPAYNPAMPHGYVAGQHHPAASTGYPPYGWPHGPHPPPGYGAAHYHPPPPHARRSLAPEYSAHPLSRQGSDKPPEEQPKPKSFMQQATSTRVKPRATSPTEIETSRRDEVANMGCTCKKSKCLKLYCMCFGASVVCGDNCRCLVCFNTAEHEAERKEAVRAILSRNPSAFDTKFKKNADKNTEVTGHGGDKVLTHKIGCKCRKSQCMKKYCECFHAGVKCSATCRCTGCQNMPPGGFGPDPRYGYPIPPHIYAPPPMMAVRKTYAMEEHTSVAAQSLAFLKHSSPTKPDEKPVGPVDPRGITTMPSLTSSDATPSTELETSPHTEIIKQDSDQPDTGVADALLMAAYAMTELNADDSPTKSLPFKAGDHTTLRASPKRKSTEFGSLEHGTTDGVDAASTSFESSPGSFSFPCSSEHKEDRDASPAAGSSLSLMVTDQRRSKRSRVGMREKSPPSGEDFSTREVKGKNDEEPENESPSSTKSETSPSVKVEKEEIIATPTTRSRSAKKSSKDELTPVSARCIDFRRMGVKDTKKLDGDVSDESNPEQMEIAA